MIRKRPISTIMTQQVITLTRDDTLEKANYLFKKHHIRHIPVVCEKKLIGVLSYEDLVRINFDDIYNQKNKNGLDSDTVEQILSIEQVMSKNILQANTSNTIREVAEIFSKREFHALPVVDDNQLVGIITTTDLINYLLKEF